jgi:uncharacterized protein (DUF169 family)
MSKASGGFHLDESLKIKMDFAESSELLKASLKLKGAPVALGFATTKDDIPSGMSKIDKRIRHCKMVSLARNEGRNFYATADKHECNGGSFALTQGSYTSPEDGQVLF